MTIQNSYWVIPDRWLAGAYPASAGEQSGRASFSWLLSQGVSRVIDLTEAGEDGLPDYTSWLQAEAQRQGRAVRHSRLSIPDFSVPSSALMRTILSEIDQALAEQQVIYLHCYGGIGRTGCVVGCYLRRQGYAGEMAIRQIARLRQGLSSAWRQSPETDAQRAMILNWED